MKEIIAVVILIMWGVLTTYLIKTLNKPEVKKDTKVLIGFCAVVALAGLIYLCGDMLMPTPVEETAEINMKPEVLVIGEDEDAKKVTVDYNKYKKVFEDELQVIKDDIITYSVYIEYLKDKIEYTDEEFQEFMKEAFEYTYGETDDIEATAAQKDLDYGFLELLYFNMFCKDKYIQKLVETIEFTDEELAEAFEASPETYTHADISFIQCDSEDILINTLETLDKSGLDKINYLEGVELTETSVNLNDTSLGVVLDNPEVLNVAQAYNDSETGEHYIVIVHEIHEEFDDCKDFMISQLLSDKANEILDEEITEFYQTVVVE